MFDRILFILPYMKILHTSDWHLGQVFYGYDRQEEHTFFFERLKEAVMQNGPDALLVSGDIFDVSNPSSGVARMFKDRVLELHALFPETVIIVTAGNHDSASRIDIDRNLWRANGVHVIGSVGRKEGEFDFSGNIIEIPGKGFVAAIPFVNRTFMSKCGEKETPESVFFRKVAESVSERNPDNLPVVLMTHLAVTGCDQEGHRDNVIGGLDSTPKEVFGEIFDYVALGHIHKPQQFDGGRISYCGSPLPLSFDESFHHGVNFVDVRKRYKPEISFWRINPLREMKTIPETGVGFKDALKVLKKLPEDDQSYIRLNVAQNHGMPTDCMELAAALASEKRCRFCTFKFTDTSAMEVRPDTMQYSTFEFAEVSPLEIAERFLRSSGENEETLENDMQLLRYLMEELDREDKK